MIHIPIEQRYDKNKAVFHTSAWAIAAGVTGIAAAGAGAAVSISSAQQAARAQSGAGGRTKKELKKLEQKAAAIPTPQWNIARDIKDAGQITDYNVGQLEKIFPGARTQREIASRATESLLRGEIPRDVQEQIMRSVAELGGAGFQPSAAPTGVPSPSGFQAPQGLLSRQLGMTSLQLQQMGQQSSQSWQRLAGAFIESPLQVGQARLGFEKAAADIELAKLGMIQEGVMGRYGVEQANIASRLAADQAVGQGIQSLGGALSGAMIGIGSARQAQQLASLSRSTTPLESGFYSGELGAARAANVAPSQISYQKGEGFYYNPAGPFGRADIPRSIVYGGG